MGPTEYLQGWMGGGMFSGRKDVLFELGGEGERGGGGREKRGWSGGERAGGWIGGYT